MGAYDGTGVCKLIGIFMLSLLSKLINQNHKWLCRNDGLVILKNKKQKDSRKSFKSYLGIVLQCNSKIIFYLDITLNLNYGTCRP